MAEAKETYNNIISGLITTLNRASLYPANHPLIKNALEETYASLQDFLNSKKELTFSLSAEGRILVDDVPVELKVKSLMEEFAAQFRKLEAESITFSQGLSMEELGLFLKTLLLKEGDLKVQGGISEIIAKNHIEHIKINLFSYIRVEKDKDIVAVERGRVKSEEEFGSKIKEYLLGSLGEPEIREVKDRIYRRFLENPLRLIEMTQDLIENADHLIKMLDTVGQALIGEAKTQDVKSKIAQAKQITRFSTHLKKLTGKLKQKDEIESMRAVIDEHAHAYTNEILVDVVASEYAQKKTWTSSLKNYIKRLFSKKEDKEKISAALKSNLQRTGLLQQDIDNFSAQVDKLIEEAQAKVARVDKEALHLKNENARLKSTIEGLQKELIEFEELKKQHKLAVIEKERVENIVHHMAEGLVVVDSSGQVLLMNPAAEKLLSINKQEAQGKPLRENIKDEHLLTFTKNLTPDKDGLINKEIELFSTDESTKRVLKTSSAVVENQQGQTVGMVTVLNDITRQKEIEQLKTDFVTNVSHELRTPLAVIQQSLSILTSEITDKLNDDQKKFLGNSQNNLERLRNLINDLLDMASIEAGKFKLRLGSFDINEIVSGTVTFLDKWAKAKEITLRAELLPERTEVQMDKDRVIQAVTNLIGNAVKFTPKGGGITVSLSKRQPGDYFEYPAIQVSVSDTGCGIEAKDLERIFNKFERVSIAQVAEVPGTGLGLTITREIVHMHKGKIWVESEAGKGSKFSILLPLNQ